ncbi:MAG: methyltransferase domain-containing protein [Steroidobacteraceae bacterium]
MTISRAILPTLLVAATLFGGCTGTGATKPAAAAPVTDAATIATLDRTLAGDHRSVANRARDVYRHPKETLSFFGLRQDMTVLEVWPGGGGWYTEVLAPVLRDHGHYIAAGFDPKMDSKYQQDGIKAFADKLASRPDLYGKATVTALQHPNALQPVPDDSVDMVLTFRNLHNWMSRDAAEPMLAAMFRALKPGGILGMVEHHASDSVPQDPHAKSGYVREDYAIALAKAAGFELIGKSSINANPKDAKDYPQGVWTLPPTFREGDVNRERYAAIGESDRFTLRFRKPL